MTEGGAEEAQRLAQPLTGSLMTRYRDLARAHGTPSSLLVHEETTLALKTPTRPQGIWLSLGGFHEKVGRTTPKIPFALSAHLFPFRLAPFRSRKTTPTSTTLMWWWTTRAASKASIESCISLMSLSLMVLFLSVCLCQLAI